MKEKKRKRRRKREDKGKGLWPSIQPYFLHSLRVTFGVEGKRRECESRREGGIFDYFERGGKGGDGKTQEGRRKPDELGVKKEGRENEREGKRKMSE